MPKGEKFSEEQIDYYQSIFDEQKENGKIRTFVEFHDNVWVFNGTRINFFRISDPFFIRVLKCYCILLYSRQESELHIQNQIHTICTVINESNNFSADTINDFKEVLVTNYPIRYRENVPVYTKKFFSFYKPDAEEGYVVALNDIYIMADRKPKTLPPYHELMLFDEYIKEYMDECEKEKRNKYLPLFIFWRLTTIIPLRPKEFFNLKKSDFILNDQSTFTMRLNRSKAKNNYAVPIQNEFILDEEITSLIKEYMNFEPSLDQENITDEEKEYVFPYYKYNHFLKGGFKVNGNRKRSTLNITGKIFRRGVIEDFYSEVLDKIYGYKLKRISPSDTRHLAICSMKLQGFSPLIIAKLAGHTSLKMQEHYINHFEYFAEATTNILAEKIARVRNLGLEHGTSLEYEKISHIYEVKRYHSILNNSDANDLRVIQNGFCKDDNFPLNCVMNCFYCDHYVLDYENSSKMKKDLLRASIDFQKEVENKIKALRVYYSTYTDGNDEDKNILNDIRTKGIDLEKSIKQKASIDANIKLL